MKRHHTSRANQPSSSDSESEDDAFTVLSKKKKSKKSENTKAEPKTEKRSTDDRQEKMNALLYELEENKTEFQEMERQRGSFVEDGEELSTTNIFVANLSPTVTEEALTTLFGQFGNLYSVKIMWPRTQEEKARNRNTGFVCYVNRGDAQEAMDVLNYTDPFCNGRKMVLRWGKNVNMDDIHDPIEAIRVILPPTHQFITTVSFHVSKDGSILEQKLIARERHNPTFSFLFPFGNIQERIFYRWRVYAFTQGDGYHYWNTNPFQMFVGGKFWIPPPLVDTDKAALENIKSKKPKNAQVKLNNWEKEQFQKLFKKLSISRASICQMMSFCFDKSAAAIEISSYIHDSFTFQKATNQHINKLIARLYLLSDILFNSQQPGVRNAFKYRETIQKMTPDIFKLLGEYKVKLGRITWNKLKNSVGDVLAAWSDWGVYHDGFLKELEDYFHFGKVQDDEICDEGEEMEDLDGEALDEEDVENDVTTEIVDKTSHTPRGGWEVVNEDDLIDEELDGESLQDDDVLVYQ